MGNFYICKRQVEILVTEGVLHVILDIVPDGVAEVGVHSVVLVGDGLRQLRVVHLDVPHGHLERVPLGLDELPGLVHVLGLGVALVPPLLQEVLELLLAQLRHLIFDVVGFNLDRSNIHGFSL